MTYELGVPLELVMVDATAWDNEFGRINPINRIPALELEDGRVLFDSPVICEYLDTAYGPRLLPSAGLGRWDVLVQQALGDGIMDAAVPRRHETVRPSAQQSSERLALYRRSIDQVLDHLEKQAKDFYGFDLGLISIACALSYLDFRFPGDQWSASRLQLKAWGDTRSEN